MSKINLGKVVGDSAYETWLKQGNTGTEEEFLNSLKAETHEHENKSILDSITQENIDAWNSGSGTGGTALSKVSELENDSGYITAEDLPVFDIDEHVKQISNSVNIYEPVTEGWVDNATLLSNGAVDQGTNRNDYAVTPSIPVRGNVTYTIKPSPFPNDLAAANRARTYDYQGVPLDVMTFIKNEDGSVTFTTPESSETIRFTVYVRYFAESSDTDIETVITAFNSSFMLVEGTKAPSEYIAFGDGDYMLKDIDIPNKSVSMDKIEDKTLAILAGFNGKTIVNFGDSIYGNARPPEDISTFLSEKTGATVKNCAFGGCRMGIHEGNWDAFSMYRLAYSIANNDFTLQDEALNHDDRTSYAEEPLALIKSTDFSKVDIVTIAYCTNDFTGGNAIDNEENLLDTTTLGGALRYSIETLLGAYPNLRIFIVSATWRFWMDDNNEYTEDSNTFLNKLGKSLFEYNAKLKEIAEEYNLPFIDNYNIGITKNNRFYYFAGADGAHHIETGRRVIASHLAKELY